MVRRVSNGRHVRDDDSATPFWITIREVHGRFAAHAVTQQVGDSDTQSVQGVEQVDDHIGISMTGMMGASAVIALVYQNDLAMC